MDGEKFKILNVRGVKAQEVLTFYQLTINKMKTLFWKTYKIEFITTDKKLSKIEFMRGFTWEVVLMAQDRKKEISEKENKDFVVNKIERIY